MDEAFSRVLPMPLADLFRRWYGAIPPVRSTDEDGVWGVVGQQRHVDLVGPGSMTETLTEVDAPSVFAYRLTDVAGPMSLLVSAAEGRWEFEPAGTGVRITWAWDVALRPLGRLVSAVFRRMWLGYAKAALAELERHLVAPAMT